MQIPFSLKSSMLHLSHLILHTMASMFCSMPLPTEEFNCLVIPTVAARRVIQAYHFSHLTNAALLTLTNNNILHFEGLQHFHPMYHLTKHQLLHT